MVIGDTAGYLVTCWRLATLPKAVFPDIVQALLASCDRRTTYGRRDFVVLMLLSRLGLRAGEVAGRCLDDIDWRARELIIRGDRRADVDRQREPFELAAGTAPMHSQGGVHQRPRPAPETEPGRDRAIVRAACKRSGVDGVHAHRPRHSVATQMLAAGAGLAEIGQVLRHDSLLTTAIYAKVDRDGLRALASPWLARLGEAHR